MLQLAAAATAGDGVAPLSEHVMLHLRYGGGDGLDLTSGLAGQVTGYAHLEVDESGVAGGELVVDPAHRRRGAGRALLAAMTTRAAERPLRVWAHGDLPAAAAPGAGRRAAPRPRPVADAAVTAGSAAGTVGARGYPAADVRSGAR